MSESITGIPYSRAISEMAKYKDELDKLDPCWGIAVLDKLSSSSSLLQMHKYLKKGGESMVVHAWDRTNKREVAVKVALPDTSLSITKRLKSKIINPLNCFGPKKSNVFKKENPFTARIGLSFLLQQRLNQIITQKSFGNYGHVPIVYSIGASPHSHCVMEFIRGESLEGWVEGKTHRELYEFFFNLVKFIKIVLHEHSIAHCDIKPANIMVRNGLPVLLDFGLFKNLSKDKADLNITVVGEGMGTPLYSPEEMRRNAKDRDYRVDIYGLGRILWVLWNGGEPSMDCFISSGRIKDDIDVDNIFPDAVFDDFRQLKNIYKRATGADKKYRYQDIVDLEKDLELISDIFVPGKIFSLDPKWESYVKNKNYVPIIKECWQVIATCLNSEI